MSYVKTDIASEFESVEAVFNSEDIDAILEGLRKKADEGDAKTQFLVGHGTFMKFFMEYHGKNAGHDVVNEVNKNVIEWTTKSANQGYALAQYTLSSIYSDEERCEEVDHVQGLMWAILGAKNSYEDEAETIEDYIDDNDISEDEIQKSKAQASEWQPIFE